MLKLMFRFLNQCDALSVKDSETIEKIVKDMIFVHDVAKRDTQRHMRSSVRRKSSGVLKRLFYR